MAWIIERRRQIGVAYEFGWTDEERRRRTRTFDSAKDAQRFAASIGAEIVSRPQRRGVSLGDRIRAMSSADENACWVWQGKPSNAGYGQMTIQTDAGPKTASAHRVSYETFVGRIPDGLVIDHLCRCRLCVNPEHLEAVTQRENVMRSPIAVAAQNAAKTHCPRGHEYDGHGLLRRNGTTRMRWCRACMRESQRILRARRRSA